MCDDFILIARDYSAADRDCQSRADKALEARRITDAIQLQSAADYYTALAVCHGALADTYNRSVDLDTEVDVGP